MSLPAPEPKGPDPVPAGRHLRPVQSAARRPAGESRRAGSERRPLGMPLVAALDAFFLTRLLLVRRRRPLGRGRVAR